MATEIDDPVKPLVDSHRIFEARDVVRRPGTPIEIQIRHSHQIENRASQVDALLRVLDEGRGWPSLVDRCGISAFGTAQEDGMFSALFEFRVDSPLPDVLACASEMDLYGQWAPYVSSTKCLGETISMKAICVRAGGFPWPLSSLVAEREIVVVGSLADLLATPRRSVVVVAREPNVTDGIAVPPITPGATRAMLGLCGMEVIPESPKSCTVRAVGSCDPKIPLMPSWVFSFGLRVLGTHVASTFREACSRPENAERVRTRLTYAPIICHLRELFQGSDAEEFPRS